MKLAVAALIRNYFSADEVVPSIRRSEIPHLPIRSHAQLKSRVMAGALSVMSIATRNLLLCWHWCDSLWRIAEGTLRDEDLDPARLVAVSLRRFQIEEEAADTKLTVEGNRLRFIPQESQQ